MDVMNPSPKKQFAVLESLCSAAALCLAIGSLSDLWSINLPIALLLLAVLYGVLRDLRSLNRLNDPVTAQDRSREAHAEQTDRTRR